MVSPFIGLPQFKKLVISVGLQPNGPMSVLQAVAKVHGPELLADVVLIHGPEPSESAARAVRRFGDEILREGSVRLALIENPFDSSVVKDIRRSLSLILESKESQDLSEWHLVYGSGTVPMNVALASCWLAEGKESHVWDFNEREKRITNANGDSVDLKSFAKVPLATVVRSRVSRDPNVKSRKRGRQLTKASVINLTAQLASGCVVELDDVKRIDVSREFKKFGGAGPILELAVHQLLSELLPTSKVTHSLELKFDHGDRESSREIDVVVEGESGKLLLVSCAVKAGKGHEDTEIRTALRLKSTEIRQLASTYFGSEAKTLTVFFTRLKSDVPPSECKIVTGARFDAQITNHPIAKHWMVSGHELFGKNSDEVMASFLTPATIDKRLPNFCAWLSS